MSHPLVIAIDGPAGSGKSSVAAALAERLSLPHVDTGAMYRAVALKALDSAVSLDDGPALGRVAASAKISLEGGRVILDGRDVGEEIRSPAVTSAVSPLAAHREVRQAMVALQREVVKGNGGVVEGRDIATVVFPDAPVKVFLTATIEERARRRRAEMAAAGIPADLPEVISQLEERDRLDSSRPVSPLAVAPGALVIDSSEMTFQAVVDRIEQACRLLQGSKAP